ncbi:hypothetical protein Scep_024973 [Stephania cephalantha]|uniref:Uncharacterized protein n=1 Tax=Stephania cephalantha TaxID=152367 RepID=A0AAP0F4U1_9MAGN
MGEQVGRRAQTASYRKEKELRRGAGASQTGCSLKEGAGKDDSMNLPGQQSTIRMSQANAVEPSSSDATESDRGEEGEGDENRDSEGEDGEGGEGEKKEVEVKEQVEVESGSGSGSGNECEYDSTEEDEEGSASEGNNERGEGEEGQDSEEVVEVRPSAKARGKAKSGPSDKVAADDMSKPFPGGPINHELLTSFNNHVAAAIWNKKERPLLRCLNHGLQLSQWDLDKCHPNPNRLRSIVEASGLSALSNCSYKRHTRRLYLRLWRGGNGDQHISLPVR